MGFRHLWALTNAAGLFRQSWPRIPAESTTGTKAGGIYLALDYWHGTWESVDKLPDGLPLTRDGKPVTHQGGTARSVATLFTLLAQQRLLAELNTDSHFWLCEMLRRDGLTADGFDARGEWSPIGQGMLHPPDGMLLFKVTQPPLTFGTDVTTMPSPLSVSKIGFSTSSGVSTMANALYIETPLTMTSLGSKRIRLVLAGSCQGTRATAAYQECLEIFGARMVQYVKTRYGPT